MARWSYSSFFARVDVSVVAPTDEVMQTLGCVCSFTDAFVKADYNIIIELRPQFWNGVKQSIHVAPNRLAKLHRRQGPLCKLHHGDSLRVSF